MLTIRMFVFLFIAVLVIFLSGTALAQILPSETTDSGLGGSNLISGTVLVGNGGRIQHAITI